jgi:uncharacterized protein YecE (DUF72 family)
MAARIRVGTCSWADEALSKYFYPPGLPAGERLSYYAEHFDTVELDSTYYRLPVESMAERWAEQTPDDFVMHVKAFGVMTRHPVKKDQLPTDLRDEAPVDDRGRIDRPPREFRAEIFRRFREALEPLRSAGKLGGTLFQFPPYVVYKDLSLDYLAWAQEQMAEDEMLVEFRHASWYEEDVRAEVLSFLEEHEMSLVVVDAPKADRRCTCAFTAAMRTPGTCGAGAQPSGSTTSTRRTSFASGCTRSGSSQIRQRTPTRSSTTTTAARALTAVGCHRPPRTRSSSSSCLQKLPQQLVETFGPVAAREVTCVLEYLQAAVGRGRDDLPRLVDREERVGVADGDPERAFEAPGEIRRIGPIANGLHRTDELVDRPLRRRRIGRARRPGVDPIFSKRADLLVAHRSALGSVGADARADEQEPPYSLGRLTRHREGDVTAHRCSDDGDVVLAARQQRIRPPAHRRAAEVVQVRHLHVLSGEGVELRLPHPLVERHRVEQEDLHS